MKSKTTKHSITLLAFLFALVSCLSGYAASLTISLSSVQPSVGQTVYVSAYYVCGSIRKYVIPTQMTISNSNAATLNKYSYLSGNYCGTVVPRTSGTVKVTIKYMGITVSHSFTAKSKVLNPPTPSASDGTYSSYVYISWAGVSGASRYIVKRGTSSTYGNATQLASTTNTYYCDSSASAGTRYYYWILPVDSNGNGWYCTSCYDSGYRANASTQTLTMTCPSTVSAGSTGSIYVKYGSTYVMPTSLSYSNSSYGIVYRRSSLSSGSCAYIKGIKAGVVYVYATYAGQTVQRMVTITGTSSNNDSSSTYGYISGNSTVRKGQTVYYKLYVGGKNVTSSATWRIAGTSLTAYKSGRIYVGNPPSNGFKSTIKATYNGKTYSKTVTIYKY